MGLEVRLLHRDLRRSDPLKDRVMGVVCMCVYVCVCVCVCARARAYK
jgi:hypothetical protein